MQPENVPCFGFGTICIIWGWSASFSEATDHPATFAKINVPPNLQNTPHMCFLAFSENFIIRFSGNEFSQDCSGHDSVKCHVWEKVYLLSYGSKSY